MNNSTVQQFNSSTGSQNPLVSIIVPSYNQGRFIRKTIDSILAQDYRPLEVIVIDGASTDETVEVLHEYDNIPEVGWVSEADKGPVEAVNKGFARAKGVFCAIQSTDDYYLPGAIAAAVDVFLNNPEVGMVYGDYVKVDEYGNELARYRQMPYTLRRLLSLQSNAVQPTVFFRLDLARELGGWDERLPYVPDTDLWIKLAFRAGVIKIDRFQACARSHADQRDTNREVILDNYKRMLSYSKYIKNSKRIDKAAAKSGLYLMCIRYGNNLSNSTITKLYWKAVLTYCPVFFSSKVIKHRLVPGYFLVTGVVAKLRRFLGVR